MAPTDFLKRFTLPDPRFSPAPIWWWSGEKLRIERLRWQMDQLLAMGIANVVILNLAPSGPLFGCDADDPAFLSNEWWEIFRQVCDHARDAGTSIWFYDQIGFSGANYQAELVAANPEFAAQQLRIVSVEGSGSLRVECPAAGSPVAAYVVPRDRTRDVKYLAIDDRWAHIDVASAAKLCLVYTVRQGYDYFSAAACQKLLDTVHRQFAARLPQHLGSTIVGSFQDELPDLPTWGDDFAERFGDVIHHLFEPGGDRDGGNEDPAEARRVRLRYHRHRADLTEAALFKPFFDWHEQHGLQCGFDQQSPAREARAIGCVQKYADYIQTHRWYAAPGCDLHGHAKLHASMAFMYDRPRVWIEGFHSTGWGGTIADTFDWLLPFLQTGANLYNPHAVYYSTRSGWWEWAPPSTCWRQPYARHYRPFAEMICRLTKLLSLGVQQADAAVLFPTATVQSSLTPSGPLADARAADETLHRLIGSMRWHWPEAQRGVLDSIPLGFHILDDATLAAAHIADDGALLHRGVALGTVILPHITMADDAVVANLRRFADRGGRIVAIGSSRIETPDGDTCDVATLPNALIVDSADAAAAVLRDTPREIRSPLPVHHRRLDDGTHILFVPATAGMTTQVKWHDWFANLDAATHDPSRYLRHAKLRLSRGARNVVRFNPVDASVTPLAVSPDGTIDLDFEGAPFALLVWSESDRESTIAACPRPALDRAIQLSDTWICDYVPTLPTEYVDTHDPTRPELSLPHTAELVCDGQTVRAGFGARGWMSIDDGPARPLVYSPKFGIAQDTIHLHRLGPKGHVPEEFIDTGKLSTGQVATVRFGVEADVDLEAVLAIGANANKSAIVNDEASRSSPDDGAYSWLTPIHLHRGRNSIELKLTAQRDGEVRAFWCLLRRGSEHRFIRPERIEPRDPPLSGAKLVYRRSLDLSSPLRPGGQVQIAAAAVLAVFVDGQFLGRQGGFDPYSVHMRAQRYALPPLAAGAHELAIELIEPAAGAPLMVDLLAADSSGAAVACVSDANWEVSRNGAPFAPVRMHSRPVGDAASWHLHRRPHVFPQAAWLEGAQPRDVVLDLPLSPPLDSPRAQSFEWILPPGATAMRLTLVDAVDAELWIDDRHSAIAESSDVALGDSPTPARRARLRVRSRQLGGGVIGEAIVYRFRQGILRTGSWLKQGLRSYSGAIRMRQTFRFDAAAVPQRAVLDLSRVRGTVEVVLNGKRLGERVLSPFIVPIDGALDRGENVLELLVTNTLANVLSTWSPTRGWSPDQLDAGVIGPIILRWAESQR